jgi:DNA-directed RNA polymerase specialized sigma24 family protein
MRVKEWLQYLEADPGTAWVALKLELEAAARAMGSKKGLAGDAWEDLAAGALAHLFEEHAATMRSVRGNPELFSWAWGVLENLRKEARRRSADERAAFEERGRVVARELRRAVREGRRGEGAPTEGARAANARERDLGILTPKQRKAWKLYRDLGEVQKLADRLKIHWTSAKERLARAARRLLEGALRSPPDRSWARRALAQGGWKPAQEALLEGYVEGLSWADLGERLGRSGDAARKRIARLRDRALRAGGADPGAPNRGRGEESTKGRRRRWSSEARGANASTPP